MYVYMGESISATIEPKYSFSLYIIQNYLKKLREVFRPVYQDSPGART